MNKLFSAEILASMHTDAAIHALDGLDSSSAHELRRGLVEARRHAHPAVDDAELLGAYAKEGCEASMRKLGIVPALPEKTGKKVKAQAAEPEPEGE